MKTRLISVLVGALLSAQTGGAQTAGQETAKTEPPKLVTKVFQLKHQGQAELGDVLSAFGSVIRWSKGERTWTLAVTDTPEKVAAVEEVVKRLDVPAPPPKNVELTVYLVAGLQQAVQETVPKELEPVMKQLRGVFSYQGFRVIDTLVVRTRDGQEAEASGVGAATAVPPESGQRTIYQIRLGSVRITPESQGNVIRIDKLKLGARVPVSVGPNPRDYQYLDTGFGTNIDVREGQKVVVGKANIDGANAMILVVTAKVVD